MIAEPPFDGSVQLTANSPVDVLTLAETFVGADGTVGMITEFEAVDALLDPALLFAVTVNV